MSLIIPPGCDSLLLVPGLAAYDRDTGVDVPLDETATVELTITDVDGDPVAEPISGIYTPGSVGDFTVLLSKDIAWPANGQATCMLVTDNGTDQHVLRTADITILPLTF